jgi:transcriptional regulator with XRE-family HTH domain
MHNLRAELAARGWTYADVADRSGIYAGRFSKWAADEGSPQLGHLVRLADALGISIDRLVRGPDSFAEDAVYGADARALFEIVFGGAEPIGFAEAVRRIIAGGRQRPAATAAALAPRIDDPVGSDDYPLGTKPTGPAPRQKPPRGAGGKRRRKPPQ